MTLQAKLWCLSNDCSCPSMIFRETKSLWRMRNTTTFPYKRILYPPNSRLISSLSYIGFPGRPSPWVSGDFWIAFPRDAQSQLPTCGTGASLGFVLVNELYSTYIVKSLLSLENPTECPSSCLLTPVPPVSVSTDNGTGLHLSGYTDVSFALSEHFNKPSLFHA